MKNIKYLPVLGLSLMLFASCDSDLDKAVFDASKAKPAEISALDDAYVLDVDQPDAEALTLKWTAPEMGYQAAVTNNIEMDINGKDFAGKVVLASNTTETSYSITTQTLNSKLLDMLENYGMELGPVKVDFRISTSISDAVGQLYSNVVTTTITPYSGEKIYPMVYVVGDYNGWGDTSQKLFSFNSNDIYAGVIDFGEKAANGFKIRGAADGWNNGNWGTLDGAKPDAETATLQLRDDGGSGNISCYSHRFYHFTFDTSKLILTKDYSFDVLGIIGDGAKGWNDNDDVIMEFDAEKQRFYADVTLKDGAIKFRADHKWDTNWGGADGSLSAGGDNINVTAGNYRVYVNVNNPDKLTYELSTKDYDKQ